MPLISAHVRERFTFSVPATCPATGSVTAAMKFEVECRLPGSQFATLKIEIELDLNPWRLYLEFLNLCCIQAGQLGTTAASAITDYESAITPALSCQAPVENLTVVTNNKIAYRTYEPIPLNVSMNRGAPVTLTYQIAGNSSMPWAVFGMTFFSA